MDRRDIRRENARWLLANECDGVMTVFARKVGRSDTQVSHWIGPNPVKGIGAKSARLIEDKFKKPAGWLDIPLGGLSEDAQWVGEAYDRLPSSLQENMVLMLQGFLQNHGADLLETAPTFGRGVEVEEESEAL